MAANTFQDVRHILQRWDKGSKKDRQLMLEEFIMKCDAMTGPELESHFHDCASLFFARLTSWLRITYMFGTCLHLQLQAIGIFVNASSSYLMEFLEVGGILCLLEIVNLKTCSEEEKTEGLRLLSQIATKGRQYKEMICESYGVKVSAECLGNCEQLQTKEMAQHLLHQLSLGNPRYQTQVYKTLVSLLMSSSSDAQRLSAYTLRLIQPTIGVVAVSIVDPLLMCLKSLHLDVQHEAGLLINDILEYEEVHQPLLMGLVSLLKHEDITSASDGGKSVTISQIQQASAARVLRDIIKRHSHLAQRLYEFHAVHHLLYAMGNKGHPDSQRQSCSTLQVIMNELTPIKELVQVLVGDILYHKISQGNPDNINEILSLDDTDALTAAGNQYRH